MSRRKFILSSLSIMETRHSPILSGCQLLDATVSHGREIVEDSRWSGRLPNFQIQFGIDGVLKESPNASVWDIAQTTGTALSTVFYILIQVLHLEFRNWRWISHKFSNDQKQITVQLAVSLQSEFERAQRRNWTEFYTDNES
jgi:hypothetical protein